MSEPTPTRERPSTQDNLDAVARQLLGGGGKPRAEARTDGWQARLKKWGPIGAVLGFMLTKAKLILPAC